MLTHSFIHSLICMYRIPAMCQDLHKLSSGSVPKSCKAGIRTPVSQNVSTEAQKGFNDLKKITWLRNGIPRYSKLFWRLKYCQLHSYATCLIHFCIALPFSSTFVSVAWLLSLWRRGPGGSLSPTNVPSLTLPMQPEINRFCWFLPLPPLPSVQATYFPAHPHTMFSHFIPGFSGINLWKETESGTPFFYEILFPLWTWPLCFISPAAQDFCNEK